MIHEAKAKCLASVLAEKSRVDARCEKLKDTVESYRNAVAVERKRCLRCVIKRTPVERQRSESNSSTSDSEVGQPRLAIEDGLSEQHEQAQQPKQADQQEEAEEESSGACRAESKFAGSHCRLRGQTCGVECCICICGVKLSSLRC